jgi:C4-dicarboxylate transporter, DctM subunit
MKGSITGYLDKASAGCGLLSGLILICMGGMSTYEVVSRYLFNAPTVWVMETTIYLVMASTFFALAYVLKEKAHVRVDSVVNYLSPATASALEVCTSALGLLYLVILDWESARITYDLFRTWEVSTTVLKVPLFIPNFFILFGSLLFTILFISYFLSHILGLLSGRAEAVAPSPTLPSREDRPRREGPSGKVLIPAIFLFLLILSLVLLKVNMYLGLLVLFFVLLFSGMPVSFALGLFAVFGFYFLFGGTRMLVQIPIMAYSTLDSPVTVALPLFVLTSCVLRNGQMGGRIYKFADVLVRHLPGGLGIASVIFCCLFAAMTGSSVAVAATVSMIALPEMLSRGYSRKFTIGLLAAGGTLGILFPPSLPLMLYGAMTGESLGALFLGTLIPGLILAFMFCGFVALVAGRDRNVKREPRASLKEILTATRHASGGLITIVVIMGGIYSGIFTPTESGGVAAIYSILLCCFIYRTLSFKGLKQSVLEAARLNSMIMFIVIGANITGQVVLMSQIPHNLLTFIKAADVPTWIVILLINILLIVLGGPLEAITILVITLPVLYPLVTGLGFSGLWFAVIMMINMELALISPPEGLNLFILQDLAKATAGEVSRGVVPYLIIMALFLLLMSLVPGLTTWLPALAAN